MRLLPLAVAAAMAALPAPAPAQRANRSISLESRGSSGASGAGLGIALGASLWLEADVHGTAAVEWAVAREPGVRSVAASAGLAWAPGTARVRPRVHGEVGWERQARRGGVDGRAIAAAGIGVEWFVEREAALTLGGSVRHAGGVELGVALGVRVGF
jgi:hypothetical protein